MVSDELKLKVSLLPECPGVYRYLNRDGEIIYVGKAKNLKRRVSSYFNRVHAVFRTNMLVRNICDLQYTVVNTEEEALDLENSLIKEFKPRYNVLLKDDKSYPWICVTKDAYPRVFLTRDPLTKGAKYYGPYPKAEVAHALIDTLRKLYPLRTCRHNVSRETIEAKKHRLCLQYHIHNCEGCCQGLVSVDQYGEYIAAVRQILNGDTKQVSDYLMQQMQQLATELKFEEAEVVKRKYLLLEKYRARSVIVSPTIHNIDVFAIVKDDDAAFVNYMHMRGGAVVQSLTLEYRLQDDDQTEASELMSMAIQEVRKRFAETYAADRVTEVLVNVIPDVEFTEFQCITPQRGDKRKLLQISEKNAVQYREEKLKRMEKLNPEQRATRTMTTLQRDFHLTALPRHIECFDNSHISGANAVASCVVFRDAKPCKKEYRHFHIKEAPAGDDYAAMREVIGRRYRRLLDEEQPLPQLLVVDGGKGQLSAAIEALEALELHGKIAAIGMAKQLNEVYFPGDQLPYFIDKNSESLRVIQRLRDEAHRFAITFHREQRAKSQTHSALNDIKGVGPKTKAMLLKEFKSLKRIREASLEQLSTVIGPKKAETLFNELKKI
ncbi:MAG: excinuclease ABC subunit C [Muribaculaceae bacterium]|nr:excinuclease ABC subunit C [Muribaculaceae bacterium]